MTYRQTLDFLLHDWLRVASLTERPRFADHSRDTFDAVLDTCERIAGDKFAPFNRVADTEEPWFDGERVHLPPSSHSAARAYAESGMLAAAQDHEVGGLQLPCVVEMAANSFFSKAGIGLAGANMLTSSNANLLRVHGTEAQQQAFARPQFEGRFAGTMCLSEPQAGSSLSDLSTRAAADGAAAAADPLGPRYRLYGNKMWISNGEHELCENIVHLVLAKIPGDDGRLIAGTRGISLFIVPKKLVDADGRLTGERNDVALAGLNHKLGYRGIPNTLLNFGEGRYPVRAGSVGAADGDARGHRGAGAIGYRVGPPHEGLRCMFHMMNEARIAVGLGATTIGYAGYEASLDYARQRVQGRPPGADGGKDATQPPVPIIRHADVKRMLLAQKSYCEGALALELYCALQVDELATGDAASAARAGLLLDVLTPIAKSWPSEWCLEANSLAIQVLGGYGYTRDFPVEQYWRDNRLNMIHEGTHGIQAIDLLGRKVVMQGGRGLQRVADTINATIERALRTTTVADAEPARPAGSATTAAQAEWAEWAAAANALAGTLAALRHATRAAWATADAPAALANATPYLQAFGHTVLAWIWLDVALCAQAALADANPGERGSAAGAHANADATTDALRGKLAAARYFFRYELPKVPAWLKVVETRDDTCRAMQESWF